MCMKLFLVKTLILRLNNYRHFFLLPDLFPIGPFRSRFTKPKPISVRRLPEEYTGGPRTTQNCWIRSPNYTWKLDPSMACLDHPNNARWKVKVETGRQEAHWPAGLPTTKGSRPMSQRDPVTWNPRLSSDLHIHMHVCAPTHIHVMHTHKHKK